MKHILILGGGITGLALLWYLKKMHGNNVKLTLLEKNARVGGWIQTIRKEEFLFERGPHSCRATGKGATTLQLVEELGLQKEVIIPSSHAYMRYLYSEKQLQRLPTGILGLLFSPLTRKHLGSFFNEWRRDSIDKKDETIQDFFTRRFGKSVLNELIDPLTAGIYAGDVRYLSMRSCFSEIYQMEKKQGSVTKGFMHNLLSKKRSNQSSFIQKIQKARLFSFKEGMEVLPRALFNRLQDHILLQHEVNELKIHRDHLMVGAKNGRSFEVDQVISTLPFSVMASLLFSHDAELSRLLNETKAASVGIVSLGYKNKVLNQEGFGYLIPSSEREDVLGMVWDSSVFPSQNRDPDQTRLTVMIGGLRGDQPLNWEKKDLLTIALDAASRHVNIQTSPCVTDVFMARKAIPQYEIGHEIKKKQDSRGYKKIIPSFADEGKLLGWCIN